MPSADSWQPVTVAEPLESPGEIVALAGRDLAVVDGAAVVMLKPEGGRLTRMQRFAACGTRPEDRFGPSLHLAGDGENLVVADTSRHRLVWLDARGHCLGWFGETDVAGDDLAHMRAPTCVGVCGDRLVVYDSGNQRLLKLMLRKTK